MVRRDDGGDSDGKVPLDSEVLVLRSLGAGAAAPVVDLRWPARLILQRCFPCQLAHQQALFTVGHAQLVS
eukprot:5374304-Pleurochrysis_carterae.AAC.2